MNKYYLYIPSKAERGVLRKDYLYLDEHQPEFFAVTHAETEVEALKYGRKLARARLMPDVEIFAEVVA